ncbi:serine carboxypeptidase S28 [Teladorsagia circumcincta]|uniref:Serine carboxypeptidase S28 n=1 Tax=Teladorsagia circumcincta TaxID=45464 RepID=A0A2G9UHU0_TELCI|nr:serine carboxypeptidase S28 [Teladorsagia circumcincta]
MYGAECWPTTKNTEARLGVMKTKMLRRTVSCDWIALALMQHGSERPIADKVRDDSLRWYGTFLAEMEACKFLGKVPSTDEDAARQLYEVTNLYYNYTGTTKSFCANAARCEGAFAALGDPMGWPWQEACKFLGKVPSTDEDAARQLYEVTNVYYNYTGTTKSFCANAARCEGAFAALGDPMGWPWQSCTEMVMPLCASGWPNDFFWKDCPFTMEGAIENCKTWFAKVGFEPSMLRQHWPTQNYGTAFPSASNIVFSNGFLDPWSGGGWSMTPKVEGTLVSLILKEGAHHYDLRGTHPDDTEEVKNIRKQEKAYIKKWIQKAKLERS